MKIKERYYIIINYNNIYYMLNKRLFTIVIVLYLILYTIINNIKPEFIYYNSEDCLRKFGVGYNNTTLFPLWLVSIILAIISYFTVLHIYYLKYNNLFIQL